MPVPWDHIFISPSFLVRRKPETAGPAQQSGPCQRAGAGQQKRTPYPEDMGGQPMLSSHKLYSPFVGILKKPQVPVLEFVANNKMLLKP